MPDLAAPPSPPLEATFKGREFEGVLDLYFYRKIGYRMARFFAALRMTPSAVSLLGGAFGLIAGHLYFYQDLGLNILGMLLHILANAFDNADGQLARLTNQQSRRGRIVDSLVDHAVFINIYIHLGLRCLASGASPWIALLVLAAGASHAIQASAADYARNAFLHFVKGSKRSHFDSHAELLQEFRVMPRSFDKALLGLYLNATRQQEIFFPGLFRLAQTVDGEPEHQPAGWWRNRYREMVGPSFRLWGFLMTNTRMLLLFAVLVLNRPAWFFWAEITVFNLLFIVLLRQQARMSETLLRLATSPQALEVS